MPITLYDAMPSANSDRVKIVLHEKGLGYSRITLSLAKKEQKNPDFLKLNPYGKVPVLDDGGKVLFESCIINEYLDERYPLPPLMPRDPYLRARGRILVDYALNYLYEPYWALRGEMIKKEDQRDPGLVQDKRDTLVGLAHYLEDALGSQSWFLGEFGLVDIDLWPRLSKMDSFGALPAAALPGLSGWVRRMKERPSVRSLL